MLLTTSSSYDMMYDMTYDMIYDKSYHMIGGNRFCVQRHEEGEFIIANGTILDARHYLKRGAPPSLR